MFTPGPFVSACIDGKALCYHGFNELNDGGLWKGAQSHTPFTALYVPIALVAMIILGSLTLHNHLNVEAFSYTSIAIISFGALLIFSRENHYLDSYLQKGKDTKYVSFRSARKTFFMVLDFFMVGGAIALLVLSLKGMVPVTTTASLLIAFSTFSFVCNSNSILYCLKQ